MNAIKMTAFNPETRKRYEVTPDTISLEDLVETDDYTPLFWADDRYVIIPGCTALMAYEEWRAQYN